MDRRSFLKSGTALAALTASIGTASPYELDPEAYAEAASGYGAFPGFEEWPDN